LNFRGLPAGKALIQAAGNGAKIANVATVAFMRSVSSRGVAMAVLLAGLFAVVGCSSTEPPSDAAGQGGGGGASGSGGASGADAGATCQSLIADYAAAFEAARTCSPLLTNVQCTQLASSSLQCPNCAVHVNDTTRLDAIRAAFQARTDCLFVPCPAILCVNPGTGGACVASDSGGIGGTCIDVR
jgi:hypothetical protein